MGLTIVPIRCTTRLSGWSSFYRLPEVYSAWRRTRACHLDDYASLNDREASSAATDLLSGGNSERLWIGPNEGIAAGCFPCNHRHAPPRPRPLLRLREHRDARTGWAGEGWSPFHAGLYSEPHHQYLAHKYSYGTST